jgi:hypothetical protein
MCPFHPRPCLIGMTLGRGSDQSNERRPASVPSQTTFSGQTPNPCTSWCPPYRGVGIKVFTLPTFWAAVQSRCRIGRDGTWQTVKLWAMVEIITNPLLAGSSSQQCSGRLPPWQPHASQNAGWLPPSSGPHVQDDSPGRQRTWSWRFSFSGHIPGTKPNTFTVLEI